MQFPAVLLVFSAVATFVSAAAVDVEDAVDETAGPRQRQVRISARLGADEVLVVRCTRWEDNRKVLETEEVRRAQQGAAGCVVTLVEVESNYWRLDGNASEQHLQGVALARWNRAADGWELELVPCPGGARHRYRFRWTAKVEAWKAVKARHPALPALTVAGRWPHRWIVLPQLPGH